VSAKGNPLFGAAVLKLTLLATVGSIGPMRDLYEGTLTDLGVTDAEVERYLEAHRAEVEAAVAARIKRSN
jgi:hypothetical protein